MTDPSVSYEQKRKLKKNHRLLWQAYKGTLPDATKYTAKAVPVTPAQLRMLPKDGKIKLIRTLTIIKIHN